MSKKILVLTGSARKGGNSNRMAQAFADAAAAKGNEVKVIDTASLKLKTEDVFGTFARATGHDYRVVHLIGE